MKDPGSYSSAVAVVVGTPYLRAKALWTPAQTSMTVVMAGAGGTTITLANVPVGILPFETVEVTAATVTTGIVALR